MDKIVKTEDEVADVATSRGAMLGDRVKGLVDTAVVPLSAYAATLPGLPTPVRIAFGAVAVLKLPKFVKRAKAYLMKEDDSGE